MASLQSLPGEVLTEIARRLTCQSDLAAMAEAVGGPISLPVPRPPVPWLMMPARFVADLPPGIPPTVSLLCLTCRGRSFMVHRHGLEHRLRLPADFNGGRMFGTYQGGWVFLAVGQQFGHAAVNIFSGTRLLFPDYVVVADNTVRPMVLIAAALSAEPLGHHGACLAAAIGHVGGFVPDGNRPPQFALWRVDGAALDQRPLARGFDVEDAGAGLQEELVLEDVAWYNGVLYLLTSREDLVAVHVGAEGQVLVAHQQLIRCRRAAERHHHRQRVVARYLVISRGELCLVVRYTIDDPRVPRRWRDVGGATRLTIYRRVTEEGVTTWTPLPGDELTGRLVFVGRGCSRSMDLDHLPSSMRNLREGIHYLDDRDARDMSIIRAEDPDQRRYRRDNQCAFGWPPLDHHLYVGRTEYPSSYSPPMWCLP